MGKANTKRLRVIEHYPAEKVWKTAEETELTQKLKVESKNIQENKVAGMKLNSKRRLQLPSAYLEL